ncbi:putative short chain dehydrogenase [Byssothecium circinans]|uniref:Putative short chain dehydrogenase n=1 Tax=Byssothecium circinans TaxID=147558 RepID=A0A6A5TXE2_9PLEO|nr:putative short chain dehydrogenase [Byssothecium circinans]
MATSTAPVVLITGANQGIGFAAAEVFAQSKQGYHILVGSRNATRGEEAVSKLLERRTNADSNIATLTLDVSSSESIKAAIETISTRYGKLDVLVNNAGVLYGPTGTSDKRDDWRYIFEVNVFGVMDLTISAFPLLRKSSNPKVVMVTSNMGSLTMVANGHVPIGAMGSPYSASKAAFNMMMLNWVHTQKDIKFWGFCPGLVATEIGGEFTRNNGRPAKEAADLVRQCVEGEREDGQGKISWEQADLPGGTGIYPW